MTIAHISGCWPNGRMRVVTAVPGSLIGQIAVAQSMHNAFVTQCVIGARPESIPTTGF